MNRRTHLLLLVACVVTPGSAYGQQLPSVSVQEAHDRQTAGKSVLVDIRTPEEWAETGVAQGAVKLDMTAPDFVSRLDLLRKANPAKEIDIICRTANRTAFVQDRLQAAGWKNIVNVRGGMAGRGTDKGWLQAGLPVSR